MGSEVKPLPCPFCGSEETHVEQDWEYAFVRCFGSGCLVEGPNALTEADAVAKWNETAALRARVRELEETLQNLGVMAQAKQDEFGVGVNLGLDELAFAVGLAAKSTPPRAEEAERA